MLKRFTGSGRRSILLGLVAALAVLALPASASALTNGSSFSFVTTNVSVLGPSNGATPAQSATVTDNVIISGSVNGNQTVSFYDDGTCTPTSAGSCAGVFLGTAPLVSSTNGSNTTACSTNRGGNKTGCSATFTVTGDQLQPGLNNIEADYAGDQFITGSFAYFGIYGATTNNEQKCSPGAPCSFTETSGDLTSTSSFSSPSGGSGELLSMVFDQQASPCGTQLPPGDFAQGIAYNISNAGLVNSFTYTVTGAAATYLFGQFQLVPSTRVCFESSATFQAYSPSGTVAATQEFVTDNGTQYPIPVFYGEVANCVYPRKGAPPSFLPCLVSATYKSPSKTKPATFAQVVDVPQVDARLHY